MSGNRITYVRIPTALYSVDGLTTLQVNVLALIVGFDQDGLQLSSEKLADVFGVTPRAIDQAVKVMTQKGYIRDLVGQSGKRRNLIATPEIFSVVKGEQPLKNIQSIPEQNSEQPLNDFRKTSEKCSVTTKQKLNKQKRTKTFSPMSDEVRLSQLLLDLILARKGDYKRPDIQIWARCIDLMIHIDRRDPKRIEAVIRWCQADAGNGNGWAGWRDNILSTAKLREKFDKLELAMENARNDRNTAARGRFQAAPDALTI
ncbi:MAG: hypothetical protein JW749_03625 [Sedimentisphaerales bacterium]|nr:hypothetical protein [Sedimentisphaerales bacterium]